MAADLSGAVALVTGASSGIGAATALSLAELGATVVIAARRADRLDGVAQQISAAGARSDERIVDLLDPVATEALVPAVVADHGRLDILVNCAGVMLHGPVEGAPLAEWEQMVELNITSVLRCTHAALPHLVAAAASSPRGVADLVNISSVAGRVPRAGSSVYNLTKFGIGAFSEVLRQEYTRKGVRVSIVEPGITATELVEHSRPEVMEDMFSAGDGVEPLEARDIADVVAFIVTRRAAVGINELLVRPITQEW